MMVIVRIFITNVTKSHCDSACYESACQFDQLSNHISTDAGCKGFDASFLAAQLGYLRMSSLQKAGLAFGSKFEALIGAQ